MLKYYLFTHQAGNESVARLYLHPEKSFFVGRLELEKENTPSGTLRDFDVLTIIWENDPILKKSV